MQRSQSEKRFGSFRSSNGGWFFNMRGLSHPPSITYVLPPWANGSSQYARGVGTVSQSGFEHPRAILSTHFFSQSAYSLRWKLAVRLYVTWTDLSCGALQSQREVKLHSIVPVILPPPFCAGLDGGRWLKVSKLPASFSVRREEYLKETSDENDDRVFEFLRRLAEE